MTRRAASPVVRLLRSAPPGRAELLLEMDLSRGVLEAPPASPVEALRSRQRPTLRRVVEALEKAADDDRVRGLVAHVGPWQPSLAQSHELREAVGRLRSSGKRTVAWAETFGELSPGNTGYHLASAFEEVWLQPTGEVGLVGLTGQAVFLRGTLDKLGVEPQLSQRYEYKTAADTFVAERMSAAHREMLGRIVESATETLVRDVASSRGLAEAEVRAAVDEAPLLAEDAVARGLVDRLGYRAAVYAATRQALGDVELRYVERYGRSAGVATALSAAGGRLPGRTAPRTVAVVHATGPIHLGRSGGSPVAGRSVGSDTLGAALRAAGRDETVAAVVLRVDSPGGSYAASDALRREVHALRESGTPVVASMGGVAASGGYYIAMPCEKVVAGPGTLTGSIGVLAGKQVLHETFERVGVRRESVASGRYAEMFSTDRPFSGDEWQRLESWLDTVYDDFTAKAAADRGMDVERLRSLARGRVWTGADAAARGLVDDLGGLSHAVDLACRLAGVDRARVQVRTYPHLHPLARMLPAPNSESPAAAAARGAPPALAAWGAPPALGEGVPWVDDLVAALAVPGRGVLSMPFAIHLR